MNMNKTEKISLYAVYGTLKQGYGNYERLLNNDSCEFLGKDKTVSKFSLYSLGGFPGVKNGGDTAVDIEVFNVKDERVEVSVDMLEGYFAKDARNNMYNKEVIDTKFGKAYIYIYNGPVYEERKLVSGTWNNE